jgi:tRNA A-37 threonylcarbamoyl transferase component Bud32
MLPTVQDAEPLRARFLQEATIAFHLDHPNIVTVHDYGVEGDVHFIVMAFVPSVTLAERLKEGQPSLDFIARVIREVGLALDYAHTQGIVHRDVKPSNILLHSTDDTAMLADFGIARASSESQLTQADATVGTFGYMSPEQCQGETVDHRSDIYSLSVVLYEMLTGQPPFGHSVSAIAGHVTRSPAPASAGRPELSAAIDRVLAVGLAKLPEKRFGSAAALSEALDGAVIKALRSAPKKSKENVAAIQPTWAPEPEFIPTESAEEALPETVITHIDRPHPREEPAHPRRRWWKPITPRVNWDSRRARLALVGAALVLLAVAGAGAVNWGLLDLVGLGPRPNGVSDELILKPLKAALQECAKSIEVRPTQCPAGYLEQLGDNASIVRRQLIGDGLRGEQTSYVGRSTFQVKSRAVMLILYRNPPSEETMVATAYFAYEARVRWDGSGSSLASYAVVASGPAVPQPVELSDPVLAKITLDALRTCAASTKVQAPLCPQNHLPPGSTDIHWSLDSDPIVTKAAYDSTTGVYKVVGTYSMAAHWRLGDQAATGNAGGTFEALLAWTGTEVAVIRISGG